MKRINKRFIPYVIFSIVLLLAPALVSGQYFGRNKPEYKKFRYDVLETPHFDIYHYLKNDSVLYQFARMSEEWYKRHYPVFGVDLKGHNPLFVYANHGDFSQTSAISGTIGVGTGGVTEALKNRVVLPLSPVYAQTDHVLGHELVHAFQYNTIINGDSTNMTNLNNLPLWMVEGMAEYLSIGSVDGHTAMWIRDALMHDKFPTFKDLDRDPRYFPYRWGQAFWAFVGKTWGDDKIIPLFIETARSGYDQAMKTILGMDSKTLAGIWKSASALYYENWLPDSTETLIGKEVAFPGNSGNINVSPSVSPDGKYVVFLTEKDVLSLDLYLADLESGKIVKKLTASLQRHEIDEMNNLESSGTWSPDSRYFAFTVWDKGKNQLVVIDVRKNRITEQLTIPGVPSFSQPAWSPDGKSIILVGLVNGTGNLYQYFFGSEEVHKITDDRYSYLHPSWSHDGKWLLVATDRTPQPQEEPYLATNLALINMETRDIEILPVFPGAENMNPLFSADDRSVFFLSNRDGLRNLYRYDLDSHKVYRMTHYYLGITGITKYSPAISIAREKNELAYSYFSDNKYTLYKASVDDFPEVEVPADSINFAAATLPPFKRIGVNYADRDRDNREPLTAVHPEQYHSKPYRPQFKLDYISNVQAGISTNTFSRGMQGSAFAIFSDMAGDQQMYTNVALNGEIYDFGGQVTYVNQKNRVNWGASLSHIPYVSGYSYITPDTLNYGETPILVDNLVYEIMHIFEDQLGAFVYYPFSTTRRVEFGASQSFYYYRLDQWNNYFDPLYGGLIGQSRKKLDAPKGFNMQKLNAAYVLDNSINGLASPLRGARGRLDISKYFGDYSFWGITADYRKYFNLKPFTLAFRGLYTGRLDVRTKGFSLYPLYSGYPWYIHGYDNYRMFNNKPADEANFLMSQLYGEQMLVGNVELRLPFTGPERLSLIKNKYFYTELTLFADGATTWSQGQFLSLDYNNITNPDNRVPLFSAGASARINLLGAIVVEPYYALPYTGQGFERGYFGVNFLPGW